MNWFEGLIANLINTLANSLQALFNHTIVAGGNVTGNVMGNVIMSGFFPSSKVPALGTGNFSDILDPKATVSLAPFSMAFWAIGWAFFLISVYLLAMQISSAGTSATQRERLKTGVVSVIVASIMMWVGPHFAVLVTQLFYYPSDYFLSLTPLMKWTTLSTSGGQALLNSVVNFLQTILSLIVWLVYEFRKVFLFVWMVFFPLAMAFYANEKTRPVAKMWWTEWIYQMAIPFGHALIFGIASAVASPISGTALTVADIFVALAGTIGLLSSAVYTRKLVEAIAQGFGASMIGYNGGARLGQLAALGTSAIAADMGGKMAVKGTSQLVGKPLGKAWSGLNNSKKVRSHAGQVIKGAPEKFAQAIQSGASVDDIMMHHQMAAFGDPLGAGGAGLEVAGRIQQPNSSPSSSQRRPGGMSPLRAGLGIRSGTVSAIGDAKDSVKRALTNSNLGLIAKGYAHQYKMSGGITGAAMNKIASTTGNIAKSVNNKKPNALTQGIARMSDNRETNQAMKQSRITELRNHMNQVLDMNADASRTPNVNTMFDKENHTFTRASSAEQGYHSARRILISEMENNPLNSEKGIRQQIRNMENNWSSGRHTDLKNQSNTPLQHAYQQAYAMYRPAQLDRQTKKAAIAQKIAISKPTDFHKNAKTGTQAFMQDARNAVMYKR